MSKPCRYTLPLVAALVTSSTLLTPIIAPHAVTSAYAAPQNSTGKITVIVIDDLQRKPVPMTDFRLSSVTGFSQVFRTDEQGEFKVSLPAGDYTLESLKPLSFKGRELSWKAPVRFDAGNNAPIVLTDADTVALTGATKAATSGATGADGASVSEGTKLRLELTEPLISNKAKKGDEVRMILKDDFLGENKEVLIKSGAPAVGQVTYAKGAGSFGKRGKLEFAIDSITAVDGTRIPLRATQSANGKNNMLGGPVGMILLTPLLGFVKGKNVTIDRGTVLEAYVDKTVPVSAAKKSN